MEIRIDVANAAQISAALLQSPEIAIDELQTTMGSVTQNLKRETQEVMAERRVIAAGTLRAAWDTDINVNQAAGTVIGRVFNPLSYAIPVELGTKPHFPPLAPLVNWAEQKLHLSGEDAVRVARGIQRKIGRRGTEARGMAHTALAGAADNIQAEFAACARRIVARVAAAGGGAVNPGGAA